LITIDVQNDFVLKGAPAQIPGTLAVLRRIAKVLRAFRELKKPIVHVVGLYREDGSNAEPCRQTKIRTDGPIVAPSTPGAELVAAIKHPGTPRLAASFLLKGKIQQIGQAEYIVYKPRWGAFYQTPLKSL